MSYTEHNKFNPEWENYEFVYLDRTWKEIEWIYINPDANDATNHKEYLKDRHSKFFDDMCDFLKNNEPDFKFDTAYGSRTSAVMTVFSEVYSILRGVRE